ncbi:MAG TPA: sulfite exporter TauE/SafE family protein, partial [bacterium]|nr:sulfite exporter TauE/SafE family protein [bacterium]
MLPWLVTLGLGFIAGVFVGLFGIGGGVIFLPAFLIFLKYNESKATATTFAAMTPLLAISTAAHFLLDGEAIQFGLAGYLMLGAIPGVWFGTKLFKKIKDHPSLKGSLKWMMAAMLSLIGLKYLNNVLGVVHVPEGLNLDLSGFPFLAFPLGLISGFLMALTGVGGGLIIIFGLQHFFGLSLQETVATTTMVVSANVGLAALQRRKDFEWKDLFVLSPVSMAGVAVGLLSGHLLPFPVLEFILGSFVLVSAFFVAHRDKLPVRSSQEAAPSQHSRSEVRSSETPTGPSSELTHRANEVFKKDIKNFDPQLAKEFMQALLKEKAVVDKLISNIFFGHSLFDLELIASSSYTDAKVKKNVLSVATSVLSIEEIEKIQDILYTVDQGEFALRLIKVDHFINFGTIGALFVTIILGIRNARSLKDYREVLSEVEKRRTEFKNNIIPNLDTHRRGDPARNEAITTAQNYFREVIRKISELEGRLKVDMDGKGFKGVLPETFEREKQDHEKLAEQIVEKGEAKTLFSAKSLKDDLELARRFIAFVSTQEEGIAELQKGFNAINDPQFAHVPDYLAILKRLEKAFQRPGIPSARDRNDLITLAKAFAPRSEARAKKEKKIKDEKESFGVFEDSKAFRSGRKLLPVSKKQAETFEKKLEAQASWSEKAGLQILEKFPEEARQYLKKRKEDIEANIRRLVDEIGRPLEFVFYQDPSLSERHDTHIQFEISTYGLKRKTMWSKLLSFRDSSGEIHLSLDYFIPGMDPEMQHELAVQAVLAALAINRGELLKTLRERTRKILFHSPLFSFPYRQELETGFPLKKTVPLLESASSFANVWSVAGSEERIQGRVPPASKENDLKEVFLGTFGPWFQYGILADPELLLNFLKKWFFPEAMPQAIRDYIKYGRARNLEKLSLEDFKLALRHVYVMRAFGAYRVLSKLGMLEGTRKIESPLSEEERKVLNEFEKTYKRQEELLTDLLKIHDVLLIQSNWMHVARMIPVLEGEGNLPPGTLVAFPFAEREGLESSELWTGMVSDQETTWKRIAEAANHYLKTGEKKAFYALNPKRAKISFDRNLGHFEKLRELRQKGTPIHYFPAFQLSFFDKISSREELEKHFKEYLANLKAYAAEAGLKKIVLLQTLPDIPHKDRGASFQKPGRNEPDFFHTLLRSKDFFGPDAAASVHVVYNLRQDLHGPLYKLLSHWPHGSFGAPVPSGIAEKPVSTFPEPGEKYVFGNFKNVFFTIVKEDNGDERGEEAPSPEPSEGKKLSKEKVLAGRSEARIQESKSLGVFSWHQVQEKLRQLSAEGKLEALAVSKPGRLIGASRVTRFSEVYRHLLMTKVGLENAEKAWVHQVRLYQEEISVPETGESYPGIRIELLARKKFSLPGFWAWIRGWIGRWFLLNFGRREERAAFLKNEMSEKMIRRAFDPKRFPHPQIEIAL